MFRAPLAACPATRATAILPPRAIPSIVRFSSATSQATTTTTTTTQEEQATTTITRNLPPTPETTQSRTRPYLINLSASNNYPVYPKTKAAGQSKFTLIKHVEGDKRAFIQDLCEGTGLSREDIVLQPVTGHVQIKVRASASGRRTSVSCSIRGSSERVEY